MLKPRVDQHWNQASRISARRCETWDVEGSACIVKEGHRRGRGSSDQVWDLVVQGSTTVVVVGSKPGSSHCLGRTEAVHRKRPVVN